jgi:hypothetical protein
MRGEPSAASVRPGETLRLVHGARTTSPQRSPLWGPAVSDAIDDLAARVGDELRQEDGEVAPWAVPSIEAVAVLRVSVLRGERICAGLEERGKLTLDDTERHSKTTERYHRALEREALTLRSRVETAARAIDPLTDWHRRQQDGAG